MDGQNNTALGIAAGYRIDKGDDSTFLGWYAGYNATGSYNTFVGSEAGYGSTTSAPYSSGEKNTAVGYYALRNFTTGQYNVALGYYAGKSITSGAQNSIMGYLAGEDLTTGGNNVIIGTETMKNATDASNNTVIGTGAMEHNVTSNDNVVIGYSAGGGIGRDGTDTDSGHRTVAIGAYAGAGGGAHSVFIGYYSGLHSRFYRSLLQKR